MFVAMLQQFFLQFQQGVVEVESLASVSNLEAQSFLTVVFPTRDMANL